MLFEHPVQKSAAPEDGMVRGVGRAGRGARRTNVGTPCPAVLYPQLCGMWRTVSKANIQLLRAEQLRVSLITRAQPSGEVHGHILKHRALFAGKIPLQVLPTLRGVPLGCPSCPSPYTETFGAILTSSDPTHLGAGGMAMLTLSDTENNLHFILMARGLLEPGAGGEDGHGLLQGMASPGEAQGVRGVQWAWDAWGQDECVQGNLDCAFGAVCAEVRWAGTA